MTCRISLASRSSLVQGSVACRALNPRTLCRTG